MKKILAILLAIVMVFSLCACGKEQKAEKYCFNCGKGITENADFCEQCGANVKENGNENSRDITSTTVTSNNLATNNSNGSLHTHSYSKKVTTATCTQQGYTMYTCTCGHSYKDGYTDPTHSYSNNKCTRCGEMDMNNFYSCLKDWLTKNGEDIGTSIGRRLYTNTSNGVTTITSLIYSKQRDELIFQNISDLSESNMENIEFLVYITIPKEHSPKFEFSGSLFEDSNLTDACFGEFDASTFTKNSVLSCNEYHGDPLNKQNILVSTHAIIIIIIEHMREFLEDENLGYTIKDIGFTAYK